MYGDYLDLGRLNLVQLSRGPSGLDLLLRLGLLLSLLLDLLLDLLLGLLLGLLLSLLLGLLLSLLLGLRLSLLLGLLLSLLLNLLLNLLLSLLLSLRQSLLLKNGETLCNLGHCEFLVFSVSLEVDAVYSFSAHALVAPAVADRLFSRFDEANVCILVEAFLSKLALASCLIWFAKAGLDSGCVDGSVCC